MSSFLLATGNQGKLQEMKDHLQNLSEELLSLTSLGIAQDVEETGSSYEENALLKAQFFFQKTGIPTIAEDSGIEVDALPGELGVQTRRWGAGSGATDAEWLEIFLEKMRDAPSRGATFYCVAAFVDTTGSSTFFGSTRGLLLSSPACPPPAGIPLSSLFQPEGFPLVFALMSPEQKNLVSHRGKALRRLSDFLHQRSQKQ